jgi:uncharacterized protein (DUF2267 family)
MTAQGLDVFDKTLQTTHIWLNEIGEQLIPDKQLSWRVLGVVLRNVRDQLPVELSAHLGAELPLLIRGAYYDQYRPAAQPLRDRDLDLFIERVDAELQDNRPVDPRDAVRVVFATLSRHIPRGQIDKIQDALPQRLRDFWHSAEEGVTPPPEARAGKGTGEPRPPS